MNVVIDKNGASFSGTVDYSAFAKEIESSSVPDQTRAERIGGLIQAQVNDYLCYGAKDKGKLQEERDKYQAEADAKLAAYDAVLDGKKE